MNCTRVFTITTLLLLCSFFVFADAAILQSKPAAFAVSLPLRSVAPAPHFAGIKRVMPIHSLPVHIPTILPEEDRAEQLSAPLNLMPSPVQNFSGISDGVTGYYVRYAPPDVNGDVGPNHYVQLVNVDMAVYSKTGTLLLGPENISTLWTALGGICSSIDSGDPTVSYDRISDRWVISQLSLPLDGPYYQCIAVSQSGDPTEAYNLYAFKISDTMLNDYPKMAVWPDGYYFTYNMFEGGVTFSGGAVCAFERDKMLAGDPTASSQCVLQPRCGILPATLYGSSLPPSGADEYIIGFDEVNLNALLVWRYHVDWADPANTLLSEPVSLAVAPFIPACNGGKCIKQPETTQKLDAVSDRLMNRFVYRSFGSYASLVVSHSIKSGRKLRKTGVRWYELRDSGSVSLFQQGTFAPDNKYRWMSSLAIDKTGNIAMGYSLSAAKVFPSINYAGRLVTDPPGQINQGEGTIVQGTGSQIFGLSRWGDYSSMSVDPSDDCTFWFTTEFLTSNGSWNWHTQIASFKFDSCQ